MAMTVASTRHKRVNKSIRLALRTTILMLISAVVVGTLAPPAAHHVTSLVTGSEFQRSRCESADEC